MAESGMVGADTSIYNNKLFQQQPNDLGHMVGLANAMQQNKLLQAQVPLQINNAQLENSAKHLDYVNNYLAPLIALGPKVSINDLTKAANDAAANSGGAISQQEANNFVQQIVTNPNGIQPALQQMHMRVLDGQAKIEAIRGKSGWVNNGTGLQATNTNAFTGAVNTAGGNSSNVQVYPSRAEMANPATVGFDQRTGAPQAGTTQQRLNAQGGSGLLAPAFRGQPPAAPGGTPPARPGPQEVPMEQPVKMLQDDLANSSSKMQGTQNLLQAIPLVQALGPSGVGPSSETEAQLKNFLVTRGWLKQEDTTSDVRAEADKYLKKYSGSAGAAGPGGSDYRTAFASDSNPNLSANQKSTLALAKASIAFDRMEAARPLAFGNDPNAKINDYGKHKASWTQSQDVRAYGLELMDPDKRAKLMSDMNKGLSSKKQADRDEAMKFFKSLKIVDDHGMLTGTTNAGQQ